MPGIKIGNLLILWCMIVYHDQGNVQVELKLSSRLRIKICILWFYFN